MQIDCELQDIYHPILQNDQRYTVYHGGRGGGKSYGIALALVILILSETERGVAYCCLRETQKTLQDSSKSILLWAIEILGVSHLFHTSRTSDEIRCLLNDCTFKFRGIGTMSDAHRFKSIDRVKIAWIDEAQTMKEEIWDLFTPSVRGKDSRIIISFNPNKKTDFIYENFVLNPPKDALVFKVNYFDNPFFFENNALVYEMEDCQERFPLKFKHIWLGGTSSGGGQILNPAWWYRYDNIQEAIRMCHGMYITADTAYKIKTANDYSAIQCWGYNLQTNQCYLLDSLREKYVFPDLIANIKKFTRKWSSMGNRVYPERIYIEDKASGISLAQTLYRDGLNVTAWKPKDFAFPEDKVGRANEASLLLNRGCFYVPSSKAAPWSQCFVNECSDFEADSEGFDDQVDAFTMSASVFRSKGGGRMIAT
jgi:PBSX family phage terminase large subunit